jgi:hypothetical protein
MLALGKGNADQIIILIKTHSNDAAGARAGKL